MSEAVRVYVRFCPDGVSTFDEWREFHRIPQRGESILRGEDRYVVVEIDWQEDGSPFVIAHGADRPRARAMLYGEVS